MEPKRPDFEFDELFYEEEDSQAEELLLAEGGREDGPGQGENDAGDLPGQAERPYARVRGKIQKRVDTKSILPIIYERIDDFLLYLYEEGLLAEDGQEVKVDVPAQPAADATMPLNAQAACAPGASYVLIDALTDQMTAVGGHLRIGRDASFADLIPAGNNTVSAQHAELTVKQNVLIVRDIGPGGEGSSNGTFLNGVRIPLRSNFGVEAREGDILEFSNAKYRVEKI